MDLTAKAKIICQFYDAFKDELEFRNLFIQNEPGFLVARQNYCNSELLESEIEVIEKLSSEECDDWISGTWVDLCLSFGNRDPLGNYNSLKQLDEAPANANSSLLSEAVARSIGDFTPIQQAFRRGQLIEVFEEELKEQIDSFIQDGEDFSDGQRFFLYGIVSNLKDHKEITDNLIRYLTGQDDLDEECQDRLNLIYFLVNYSAGTLSSQNIFPIQLQNFMQKVDFDNPLVKQKPDLSWGIDLSILGVQERYSQNPKQFIEDSKKFFYGEASSFDYSFEPECCATLLVGRDVSTLIDEPNFLTVSSFTEYSTFVWSAYWYPKFLLMAYANPANVFVESPDTGYETTWCNAYDDSIIVAPRVPSGIVQILRFTPRILSILATKIINNHFDKIADNFINLFVALKHTRPEADIQLRDAAIQDYLELTRSNFSQECLDSYLGEEKDMTRFFEVLAACLYTKNAQLLEQLAQSDDKITRMCVALNPETPEKILKDMGLIDFELAQGIAFVTGFPDDEKFVNVDTFAEFIAGVATNCNDLEFAKAVKLRLTEENFYPKDFEDYHADEENSQVFPQINNPNLSIETMAKLLTEFTDLEISNSEYKEFFDYNDLGIPLAYALTMGQVVFTDDGKQVIYETYLEMCKLLNVDPSKEFQSFSELSAN